MTHGGKTERQLDQLIDGALTGRLSRRSIVRRAAALGLATPALGALLAARPSLVGAQDGSVSLSSYSSDPEPRRRMEMTAEAFQSSSDVSVELNTVEHEAFKQAIRTYLASDDPPDVLTWFAGNRMRFFSDKGLLLPLDELYQEQGWEEKFPQGILEVSKGSDGAFYFVPTSYYHWGVYYRPSLFEQAGIEAPPETWEQFLGAIDALKEADLIPITIGTNQPWTAAAWFDYLNMRTNGPEFHIQLMEGEVSYDSVEVKDTFAHWKELLDRQAFIDQPEALLWQDAVTPLVQGEAAMYLMGRFIEDQLATLEATDVDIDFFRFPTITEGVPVGEDAPTDGFFASAKAENAETAKELLAYLGSAEAQSMQVEEGGSPAVNQEVSLDLYDESTAKGLEMLQSSDYIAQFYDRDTHPDMAESGMAAFIEFWNNPDDADRILADLDKERLRVFEQES